MSTQHDADPNEAALPKVLRPLRLTQSSKKWSGGWQNCANRAYLLTATTPGADRRRLPISLGLGRDSWNGAVSRLDATCRGGDDYERAATPCRAAGQ